MIRVGIIGCGSISRHRHAPEYAADANAVIAGYFDSIPERACELSNKYGGKVFESYEQLLEDKSIDAVSVCCANNSHASISIAALKAGKHVLCEKPMAISLEDAEEMIKASQKAGRFLMIGHNQRLVEAHKKAKDILRSGELGRVISFRTVFGHGGPETWSADKSKNTWFFKKSDAFMGTMGDLGIHKADLIRWLIDDEIVEVQANVSTLDKIDQEGKRIEVEDNAFCILKSRSGITGTLTASWTNYGIEENSTVLYCTDGIIKICDNPEYSIEIHKKDGEKIYYKVGNIQTNSQQTKSGIIDMFINCIITGQPPEISGEEGLAALKIVFACMESSEKGCRITIPGFF